MQIDRLNFKQHYKHIVKTIQNCDIISFDCQFTGLITQLKKIQGTFPDHNEYYQRIKETALNFKIVQLGLTAFTFNSQSGQYVPQSFNFYLTPFVTVQNYNNVMIGEVQSLQFLANHGLDFQRVFTKGLIPQRILKPFVYKQHQYQNKVPSFNNDFYFNQQDQQIVDKIQDQLSEMKGSNKFQKIDFKNHAIMTFITNKHNTSLYLKKEKKLGKYEFLVKVHDVELANQTIHFQRQQHQKKVQTKKIQPKSQIKAQNKVQAKIQTKAQIKVQRKAQTKVQTKVQKNLQTKVQAKVQNNVEPKIQIKVQNKLEPKTQNKLEPKTQNKVDPKTQNKVDPKTQNKVQNPTQQQKNIPPHDNKQLKPNLIKNQPKTDIITNETKIIQKKQQQVHEIKKQAKIDSPSKKEQQKKIIKEQVKIQQFKLEQPETYQISNIIKIILNGKKPLIGHFPCLDLGLVYHTFLEDLPQHYTDFCKRVNQYFPQIFDTKVISRRIQNQLKGIKVDLKSLYMACYNKKLLQPYSNIKFDQIQEYLSTDSHHEAGYDSFITGCAFIGMANFLNNNDKQQKLNFTLLQKDNKILYSRDVGEVSLCQPYCSKSLIYEKSILIAQILKNETTTWKEAAKKLSKFGTLAVYQDHGQTYFVYEQENKKIDQIILAYPQLKLKKYSKRKMIKARQMYKAQ